MIRLPDDVVPLAEILISAAPQRFAWSVAGDGWQDSGEDLESLRLTLQALAEVPRYVDLRGYAPGGGEGYARVDFSSDQAIAVVGSDLNWVAGLVDRFQLEVRLRFPEPPLRWWQRHTLLASVLVFLPLWFVAILVLSQTLNPPSELLVAIGAVAGWVCAPPLARLFRGRMPSSRYTLAHQMAERAEHPIVETARTYAPFATITSAVIGLTVFALALSDRCNRH